MPRPSIHHVVISIAAALGLMQMTLFIGYAVYRSVQTSREIALERQAVTTLEAKVALLTELKQRSYSEAFLEELARCQGFVKPSETVMIDEKLLGREEATPCAPRALLPE